MTLLDLITRCLKDIGAYNPGDSGLNAREVQDAVDSLNNMLDSWSASGLLVPFLTRENFDLVYNQAAYTWGTGGNFNSSRPVKVMGGFIRDDVNDYPIDVLNEEQYDAISLKTDTGRPMALWYNPTYPSGTCTFYYVPDQVYQVFLISEKPIADITVLTAEIVMPPEYLAAMRWNLDADLCPSYLKAVPPHIDLQAVNTLRTLKRINMVNKLKPIKQNLFPGRAGDVWVYGNIQGGAALRLRGSKMIVTCPSCGEEWNNGCYELDGVHYFNKCGCPIPVDPAPITRKCEIESGDSLPLQETRYDPS